MFFALSGGGQLAPGQQLVPVRCIPSSFKHRTARGGGSGGCACWSLRCWTAVTPGDSIWRDVCIKA